MQNVYKQSFKREDANMPEIAVYNSGLQSCEAGHTWGPGIRDHYLIHLVTRGRGRYTAGGQEFLVGPDELFFARPNQLITYTADEKDPWEYYWVGYNGTSAARLCGMLPFTEEGPVCRCQQPSKAKDLLHCIYKARGPKVADEVSMNGYLYLFIAQLMRQKNQNVARPDTGTHYVQDALKYIQFNYSHNIGVDDIAKAVGISRSHLYRVFLKNVGQSPIDYLTDYRISEACSLLENTSLTIAEIAFSTGFFDQFYFSRVFKKIKGVAPSRYMEAKRPADHEKN